MIFTLQKKSVFKKWNCATIWSSVCVGQKHVCDDFRTGNCYIEDFLLVVVGKWWW